MRSSDTDHKNEDLLDRHNEPFGHRRGLQDGFIAALGRAASQVRQLLHIEAVQLQVQVLVSNKAAQKQKITSMILICI